MFTAPTFRLLHDVNKIVNARTTYVPDIRLHALNEYWIAAEKAGDRGDCEDFALAKRNMLIQSGVDPKLCRMAICQCETGEWHAVLTVDVEETPGHPVTWVLDNRHPEIKSYKALKLMGYKFYVRQIVGRMVWEQINPLPHGVAI